MQSRSYPCRTSSLPVVPYLSGLLHVRQANGASAAKLFDMMAAAQPCQPDTEMPFCILRRAAIAGRFAFCAGAKSHSCCGFIPLKSALIALCRGLFFPTARTPEGRRNGN
jgi:hypothetical protein